MTVTNPVVDPDAVSVRMPQRKELLLGGALRVMPGERRVVLDVPGGSGIVRRRIWWRMMDQVEIGRNCWLNGKHMHNEMEIDESLLAEARRLTGLKDTTVVMREALRALIERESARRLAKLGGSEPDLDRIPRRRSAAS